MSYSGRRGLGALNPGDAYAAGAQVVGGFTVTGLASKHAGNGPTQLRAAMAASFPLGSVAPTAAGSRDAVGWGSAYGVPAGRLYAVATLTRDGVTGTEINNAFAAVARDLSARLGGLAVAVSNVHTTGGATPLTALTPDGSAPPPSIFSTPEGTVSPLAIGGIAAVLLIPVFGLAFVAMRRPRVVVRNRRRRNR